VVLTVAVEAGIPAALALIGLTVAVALAALRATRRFRGGIDAALVAGLAAALFGEAGHGIIDNTTLDPVVLGLLWWLVGMIVAADRLSRDRPAPARPAAQPDRQRLPDRNGRVAALTARTGAEP
jgi:hypothetical protein